MEWKTIVMIISRKKRSGLQRPYWGSRCAKVAYPMLCIENWKHHTTSRNSSISIASGSLA